MSGAMLQLAAMGAEDVYFTSNPEITLFKKRYKRYTNFATETVQMSFDSGNLEFGSSSTATIDKLGDLIYKMTLVIKLGANTSKNWGYVENIGLAIIDNINITIGQEEVDVHYGDWMYIYNQLYRNPSFDDKYNKMIGNISDLKIIDNDKNGYTLYIPMTFWMTKSSNTTFPICCLNNSKFQVKITLNNAIDIINYKYNAEPSISDYPTILTSYLLLDFIFLGSDERKLFLDNDHDYLIENLDVMTDTISLSEQRFNLIFDKPCKYFIWCAQLDRYRERNNFISYAFDGDWEKARERFAKIIWLATRDGLNVDDTSNPSIIFSSTFINIGESPGLVSGGNTLLETLANKVNGILLFTQNVNGSIVGEAVIDNVVLTKNDITFEDMSYTLEEINSYSGSTEQDTFLELNSYSIIDRFNFGNFINKSDNPVVSSLFILNGREKFQERDGRYFSQVIPYQYFDNAPDDGINVFTFSLKPIDMEPTGTLNLGQVDNKDLILKIGKNLTTTDKTYFSEFFKNGQIRIFSYNYSLMKVSYKKNIVSVLYG
jgi:hypothetical protein